MSPLRRRQPLARRQRVHLHLALGWRYLHVGRQQRWRPRQDATQNPLAYARQPERLAERRDPALRGPRASTSWPAGQDEAAPGRCSRRAARATSAPPRRSAMAARASQEGWAATGAPLQLAPASSVTGRSGGAGLGRFHRPDASESASLPGFREAGDACRRSALPTRMAAPAPRTRPGKSACTARGSANCSTARPRPSGSTRAGYRGIGWCRFSRRTTPVLVRRTAPTGRGARTAAA